MVNLKSLAKDTAIYGMSSIIGRFLNYLLVPLYTNYMPKETGEYGEVTNIYALTALMFVILTFGMETTLFRFANNEKEKPDSVFTSSFFVVLLLSVVFLSGVLIFINPICNSLQYQNHHEYIIIMSSVVALDAIQAIPFSYLRFKKKPIKFAFLKLLFVCLNIGLNLLFFVWLHMTEVYYVFLINLVCTGIITFFFIPDLIKVKWHFDWGLTKRMLSYSWPILVLGIAGILNQTADKIVFPLVCDDADAKAQLGEYGACVKIAMIMAMITQAFRYAYEPIVFSKSKDKDSKEYYGQAMKYFIIFTLLAFLCVVGYMDLIKHIISSDYHEGLKVIPIVMAAEIMMGIYFNLSFWYKLIDKTIWGAIFSISGCLVLLSINFIFIPKYGYMACAWGGVAGYGVAMLLSYFIGRKYYPIDYPIRSIGLYTLLAAILYIGMVGVFDYIENQWLRIAINTILVIIYLAIIAKDILKQIKK